MLSDKAEYERKYQQIQTEQAKRKKPR